MGVTFARLEFGQIWSASIKKKKNTPTLHMHNPPHPGGHTKIIQIPLPPLTCPSSVLTNSPISDKSIVTCISFVLINYDSCLVVFIHML